MNMNARPRRNPEVAWNDTGQGSLFLVNGSGDGMYELIGLAGKLWQDFDGERTLGEIAESILQEYEIDRDTLEQDLTELVTDLERRGLLVLNSTP
jgi:hypothetical protein